MIHNRTKAVSWSIDSIALYENLIIVLTMAKRPFTETIKKVDGYKYHSMLNFNPTVAYFNREIVFFRETQYENFV